MTKKKTPYEKRRDAAEKELLADKRDSKPTKAEESREQIEPTYKVGYGRPPEHTRVKKGQVLNPNGRPQGSKNNLSAPQNFYNLVLEEAHREMPLGDNSGRSMPMQQVIVRATDVCAAKGNTYAQRLAVDMIRFAHLEIQRFQEREIGTALDFKRVWNAELRRRKKFGLKLPDPIPHPDHVEIELATGSVNIRGPATEQERIAFQRWPVFRAELHAELQELQEHLNQSSKQSRFEIEHEISRTEKVLEIVGRALEGNRDALKLLEDVYASQKRIDAEFAVQMW